MQRPFEFLCSAFPKVDRRVIKATVLEHGDDIESAIIFLVDNFDGGRETSYVNDLIDSYESFLCQMDQSINSEKPLGNNGVSCENIEEIDVPQTSASLPSTDDRLSNSEETFSRVEFQSADMCDEDSAAGSVTYDRFSDKEAFRTECSEFRLENNVDMVGSSQLSTKPVEELVYEAQRDKEYVMSIIKTVSELQSKVDMENAAAETAKVEADRNEKYFLIRAADTHRRMQQMKQDNLVRRGELYGEKAVLALEMRELKVRLEQVKQQKENAVTMLLYIREKLQAAYETALVEREHAETERKIKEEMGQNAVALEEALLTVEEQESKQLDKEAEAYAQLRKSFLDHGNIIDVMQGEMSILCEDIESFKKRVDDVSESSSMSTASLHSVLNSGMPYSFRKCYQPIADSNQQLRKSFDGDKITTRSNFSIDAIEVLERSDISTSLILNFEGNDVASKSSSSSHGCFHGDMNGNCFHSTFNIEVDSSEAQMQSLDNASYEHETNGALNPESKLNSPTVEGRQHLPVENAKMQYLSDDEASNGWNLACEDDCKPVDHWVLTGKQLEEMSSSTSSFVNIRMDLQSVSSSLG